MFFIFVWELFLFRKKKSGEERAEGGKSKQPGGKGGSRGQSTSPLLELEDYRKMAQRSESRNNSRSPRRSNSLSPRGRFDSTPQKTKSRSPDKKSKKHVGKVEERDPRQESSRAQRLHVKGDDRNQRSPSESPRAKNKNGYYKYNPEEDYIACHIEKRPRNSRGNESPRGNRIRSPHPVDAARSQANPGSPRRTSPGTRHSPRARPGSMDPIRGQRTPRSHQSVTTSPAQAPSSGRFRQGYPYMTPLADQRSLESGSVELPSVFQTRHPHSHSRKVTTGTNMSPPNTPKSRDPNLESTKQPSEAGSMHTTVIETQTDIVMTMDEYQRGLVQSVQQGQPSVQLYTGDADHVSQSSRKSQNQQVQPNVTYRLSNPSMEVQPQRNAQYQTLQSSRNAQGLHPNMRGTPASIPGSQIDMQISLPNTHETQPNMQRSHPNMQGSHPSMQGSQTNVQRSHSNMQGSQSNMQGSQPNMQGYQTNVQRSHPNMQGNQPNMQGSQPNMQGSQPNMQGSQTNMQGSQPNMQGSQPNIQGYQPTMHGSQSNILISQPGMQGSQPNMQNSHSNVQGSSPSLCVCEPQTSIQVQGSQPTVPNCDPLHQIQQQYSHSQQQASQPGFGDPNARVPFQFPTQSAAFQRSSQEPIMQSSQQSQVFPPYQSPHQAPPHSLGRPGSRGSPRSGFSFNPRYQRKPVKRPLSRRPIRKRRSLKPVSGNECYANPPPSYFAGDHLVSAHDRTCQYSPYNLSRCTKTNCSPSPYLGKCATTCLACGPNCQRGGCHRSPRSSPIRRPLRRRKLRKRCPGPKSATTHESQYYSPASGMSEPPAAAQGILSIKNVSEISITSFKSDSNDGSGCGDQGQDLQFEEYSEDQGEEECEEVPGQVEEVFDFQVPQGYNNPALEGDQFEEEFECSMCDASCQNSCNQNYIPPVTKVDVATSMLSGADDDDEKCDASCQNSCNSERFKQPVLCTATSPISSPHNSRQSIGTSMEVSFCNDKTCAMK